MYCIFVHSYCFQNICRTIMYYVTIISFKVINSVFIIKNFDFPLKIKFTEFIYCSIRNIKVYLIKISTGL